MKRYHKQWSEAKKVIVSHITNVKEAMERLDPESLPSGELDTHHAANFPLSMLTFSY